MKKLKVTEFSDSQHGWLAVKRSLINELGLANEISHFSYQKGETVYLEEDSDATKFLKAYAIKHTGTFENWRELFDITVKRSDRSAIRSYAAYNPNKVENLTVGMKVNLYGKIYTIEGIDGKVKVKQIDGIGTYTLKPSQVDECIKVLDV